MTIAEKRYYVKPLERLLSMKAEDCAAKVMSSAMCPCCLSRPATIRDSGQFKEYQCNKCDHIWFDWSASVTRGDYETSTKYDDYYIGEPPYLWYHKKAREYILKRNPSSRILDFGCYDGFFTRLLVDEGLDAYGCDWNRIALARGRSAFGLGERLKSGPEGDYDIITALEVIEHFEDPNEFLDVVLPALRKQGELIISCPNKNSIYRPKTDAPPHHFSRFSKSSLRKLLERRGFNIVIHLHEMSSFQLLRNLAGDALRHDGPLSPTEPQGKRGRADVVRPLKRLANSVSGGISSILSPVDYLMHCFGLAYISQFIVVRRTDVS